MGYWELLVRLNGAEARWEVIGPYEESLANLQADDSKAEKIDSLTEGQKQSLEWVAGAMGIWKDPRGVTAAQVANAKLQAANRIATSAEVQTTRKQLLALHKPQLLTKQKVSNVDYFSIRGGVGCSPVSAGEVVGVELGCTQVHPSPLPIRSIAMSELYPSHPKIRTLCV